MTRKKPVPSLPDPSVLERLCKGLAALDAIACEDWEGRYHSFNCKWDAKRRTRMASMRNGSGDDWFLVFAPKGTFLKSFWHEYPRAKVAEVYAGLPPALAPQLKENAFMMDEGLTFGGWHDGSAWTLRGDARPMKDELALLSGDPAAYCAYAEAYFERELPRTAVAQVLAGKPLTQKLVAQLGEERSLEELKDDLEEIGYGR